MLWLVIGQRFQIGTIWVLRTGTTLRADASFMVVLLLITIPTVIMHKNIQFQSLFAKFRWDCWLATTSLAWFSSSATNSPVQHLLNYCISVFCCFFHCTLFLSPKVKTSMQPSIDPSFEPSAGASIAASKTPSKVWLDAIPNGSLKHCQSISLYLFQLLTCWSDDLIFLDG